jgi:hypothetical protein
MPERIRDLVAFLHAGPAGFGVIDPGGGGDPVRLISRQ